MKRKLSFLILLFLLAGMLASCGLTVPRPEIKEGRFNYSVTYELGGETKTVSGVYICEYNGTSWALDGGSHRDWKGYLEGGTSSDDWITIGATEDGGKIILSLSMDPDYFMGETVIHVPEPYLLVSYPLTEGDGETIINEADVVAEQYGAKILSFDYDEPIKNSFGLFK
jgi:hypothetical protein